LAHAHRRRRRTRDRASDRSARPPAGSRPPLGAARGAVSHQEARANHGTARRGDANRARKNRDLPGLRQYRHSESLHGLHRYAARSRHHRHGRRRRRPLGARARARDQCPLSRARRHALAPRRHRPAGSFDRRARVARPRSGGDGGDPCAQRHGRRADHGALHHRPAARRQCEGNAACARRAGRRRTRLSRRRHARGGDPATHDVLIVLRSPQVRGGSTFLEAFGKGLRHLGNQSASTILLHECPHATKSEIAKLPHPSAGQAFYRDDKLRGFAVRVTAGGTKSFVLEKLIHRRVRRITLGRCNEIAVETARRQAQKLLGQIAEGRDPVSERKRTVASSATLSDVFDEYLEQRNLKQRTATDYRRIIEIAFADWCRKPLASITRDGVSRRFTQLRDKHGPAWANLCMRLLRALFNFAAGKYADEAGRSPFAANPVRILSETKAWVKIDRRRSVIKPHELADWYRAVQN